MKTFENIRRCATEHRIAEDEVLKKGLEGEFREFTRKGSKLFAKA